MKNKVIWMKNKIMAQIWPNILHIQNLSNYLVFHSNNCKFIPSKAMNLNILYLENGFLKKMRKFIENEVLYFLTDMHEMSKGDTRNVG